MGAERHRRLFQPTSLSSIHTTTTLSQSSHLKWDAAARARACEAVRRALAKSRRAGVEEAGGSGGRAGGRR